MSTNDQESFPNESECCLVCKKKVAFILCHLRKNLECQESYDMRALIENAKDRQNIKKRARYKNNQELEKKQRIQRYKDNKGYEKEQRKQHYKDNQESEKEQMKQRYMDNREFEKEQRKQRYKDNPESEKEQRKQRYKDNPESEKEQRKQCYKDNQEREKHQRVQRYNNNPIPEKQYNMKYHQENREKILPKMRDYNKRYKPFRAAINKLRERIISEHNPFHGRKQWYLTDSAFHLYYHTLGKCDLNSVVNARHSIQELKDLCDNCGEKLYSLVGSNKLHCMHIKCGNTICSVCRKCVPADPRQDYQHFYLHSGILPGMCPLFKDFDSLPYMNCSNSKPCTSTEPTVIQLNDYDNYNLSTNLPTAPCIKCEEVMEKNPSLIEKCLKVQKFGYGEKDGKLRCGRTGLEVSKADSLTFFQEKEFRFFNCYFCGWNDKEKHEIYVPYKKDFETNFYKIPISVDQKIFYIDHPYHPESCFFGNKHRSDHRGDGTYTNFEHICNLNEHLIDHSPEGKSCVLIELKLSSEIDPKLAKKLLREEMINMESIHTVFAIKTILQSCEEFRLKHATWDQFKQKAKSSADHQDYVANAEKLNRWSTSRSACDFWKLGKCSDGNIIVMYLLLKRKANPKTIFESLDKSDFVSEWMLTCQEPFSTVSKYQRSSCYCDSMLINNPFCPFLVKIREDQKQRTTKYQYEYEHINDCILPGIKSYKEDREHQNSMLNKLTEEMLDFFVPKYKVLLKYCQCEEELCLKTVKGWDCKSCNSRTCESGNFYVEDIITEGQKIKLGKPYCISSIQGKHILQSEFMDINQTACDSDTDSYSDSDTESDDERSSEQRSSEDDSSRESGRSDEDGFMDQVYSD